MVDRKYFDEENKVCKKINSSLDNYEPSIRSNKEPKLSPCMQRATIDVSLFIISSGSIFN